VTAVELETLFAAIRRERDPELLAALFERVGPWLVRRARRLLGRASLAEDLVQDLFLGLLEHGHGCDPGRPCRPYLLGMLHRRAARIRRREGRTLAQGLRDAIGGGAGPLEHVITAEARTAVRLAVEALPRPYREVVSRHLAHRSPAQIGRELGRTANAVRVQLHRGLRLLRASLPAGLVLLLCTVPARPLPAQGVRPRVFRVGVAMAAAAAMTTLLGVAARPAGPAAHALTGAAVPHAATPPEARDASAPSTFARTAADTGATNAALELQLRHADGSPAAAVGVVAHVSGADPDFDATTAVSGTDGRATLRGLPPGPIALRIDRGLRLTVDPARAPLPHVVVLPRGADVAGVVHDAAGRPAANAGVWLCRDARNPTEGDVVARTDGEGRFVLRGVPLLAFVGAVAAGSVPATLHQVEGDHDDVALTLGAAGARVHGRVLAADGAALAGAVVRVAGHPRASFVLPAGPESAAGMHPCAAARTDAAGEFALADLPPGPLQVLVRAPGHRAELQSVVGVAGGDQGLEVRLQRGVDLDGEVRDAHGAPVGDALVLARGRVRSAWAAVRTGPDGAFRLVGLDPDRVLLDVEARGFAKASAPAAAGGERVAIVLQPESRPIVALEDACGAPAVAPAWELAARSDEHGPASPPRLLEPTIDGFLATGDVDGSSFLVRRSDSALWLRAERIPGAGGGATRVRAPAAAQRLAPLRLALPGTTAEQRASVILMVECDGLRQPLFPAAPDPTVLEFGRVPIGEHRVVLHSRGGALPAHDLGVVAVPATGEPLALTLPPHGWLRYRVQRTDRAPVQQGQTIAVDERGLVVPLRGTEGRVALAAGRYQLWTSSLSFVTTAQSFEVTAAAETTVDLELSPGRVRHVAFRLPPAADPQRCRARVRPLAAPARGHAAAPGPGHGGRGFDVAADGLCYTTLVLGDGDWELAVQCGDDAFRCVFAVAGDAGIAEPIEVELVAQR
jgi:RNA polymerase sigma-70 factor (ECF subfamily)